MIAQKRQDAGLDLYVVTSNGMTANAPALWLEARNLDAGARFLPARIDASNSKCSGLLAMEDVDGALAVSQLANTDSAFTANYRTSVYKQFDTADAKFAAGNIDGDGIDDLVVLAPLSESTGTRVWTMKGGAPFGPVHEAATLADVSFADSMPALIHRNGHESEASLVLFRRANVSLQEFYFTGGAPSMSGYDFDKSFALGPVQIWGDLPGLFSESLWLKSLAYWQKQN